METLFVVGAPLTLAILEVFHPMVHDLFDLPLELWLGIHYAQMFLFAAAALAVAQLLQEQQGLDAWIARLALFVFAVTYVAFDTAAGVVTAELVRIAKASGTPETWRTAVYAIWEHPIIGGTGSPILAVAGSVALSIAGLAAAVALRRSGRSWGPVVLLAACPFGIALFRTHAWPGGPLTFGLMSLAAAWTQWEKTSQPE
jgi:hypothetical protein